VQTPDNVAIFQDAMDDTDSFDAAIATRMTPGCA
jgi:hypothetical protein